MTDTILFDLDGTLLPVSQEEFTKGYFKALAAKIVPLGYGKDEFVKAIWQGTGAMQKNDGSSSNCDKFWKEFAAVLGEDALSLKSIIDEFYVNEFNQVKSCLLREENHGALIKDLKEKGYTLVLASNPVFPSCAVRTRLSWIGIDADDFDYITHYENSSYCKPNIGYYEEILKNIGKNSEQCVMIGNNYEEDGIISRLGAKAFIVTEIPEGKTSKDDLPMGSFRKAIEYALSL